jgi:hypothetical protein
MFSLLNRKAVKKHILNRCETHRPGWNCQRVSKQALDEIDGFIRDKINQSIHRHPTKGKTFMHFE